jgi:hypothetical protein
MTDSGTVGSSSNPEQPPPPSTPPNNSTTAVAREAYGGGADERTPLLTEQPKPIPDFQVSGQNKTIPRSKLFDNPNHVTCPHCSKNVFTRLEHNRPSRFNSCFKSNCSCWCCLCYTLCIPFCVSI